MVLRAGSRGNSARCTHPKRNLNNSGRDHDLPWQMFVAIYRISNRDGWNPDDLDTNKSVTHDYSDSPVPTPLIPNRCHDHFFVGGFVFWVVCRKAHLRLQDTPVLFGC